MHSHLLNCNGLNDRGGKRVDYIILRISMVAIAVLKRLAACDEDDCMNSPWADPKGMKRELQGLGDIKAPGLRF